MYWLARVLLESTVSEGGETGAVSQTAAGEGLTGADPSPGGLVAVVDWSLAVARVVVAATVIAAEPHGRARPLRQPSSSCRKEGG